MRNVGKAAVDLDGYRLWSIPHVYAFPRATVLAPGESLRIDTVGGPGGGHGAAQVTGASPARSSTTAATGSC